ncbi:MAG: ATP-binding protein [Planctomycetota bacterium]|nr:MAG: ATP-binding protein [Planctomycetota bacterium]
MIQRTLLRTAQQWAAVFRVIVITGPRQSGKTTLAQQAFPKHHYVSLENPDQRLLAQSDPRGFLAPFRLAYQPQARGVILDEIQRCPELLSYLQEIVDREQQPGRWILTGSAHFHVVEAVTQSLAGRAGLLELMTCSQAELAQEGVESSSIAEALFSGAYPEVKTKKLPPLMWYQAYLDSVLERDLRQIVEVRNLDAFQRFVRLCAGRVGQIVNRSSLGADAGVSSETVDRWLSALQAAHIIFLLRPHFQNFGKRLVKSPKLYFTDPALAVSLLGIREVGQVPTHPLRGNLFENWVLCELRRTWCNAGEKPPMWFWRDQRGTEIDCIIEQDGALMPIEIKSGQTVAKDWFKSLQLWQGYAGAQSGPAHLIYGGDTALSGPQQVTISPWHETGTLFDQNRSRLA